MTRQRTASIDRRLTRLEYAMWAVTAISVLRLIGVQFVDPITILGWVHP